MHKSRPADTATSDSFGGTRFLDPDIEEFCRRGGNRAMVDTFINPTYRLPNRVIEVLARKRIGGVAFFSPADVTREQAFDWLCNRHLSIGFWRHRTITNTPLNERIRPQFDSEVQWRLRPFSIRAESFSAAWDSCTEMATQVKGYAGYLLTDPSFLVEADALRQIWEQLPENQQPMFPLGRIVWVEKIEDELRHFGDQMYVFLNRYELMCMATWDVPCPQGPLWPNLLPPNAPAQPRHGVNAYTPNHFRLRRDDALARVIEVRQRQQSQQNGLAESAASLRKTGEFAQLLDVLHLRRAIQARFPEQPIGIVDATELAIASALSLSTETVHRYRKKINQLRRG